jgi:hypothetical protein
MSDTLQQSTDSRLIAADKVQGTPVFDRDGEKLGSVKDIYIDKRSGHAEFASLAFGGVLGLGEKYHPLPWRALTYDVDLNGFVVDIDREVLTSGPAFLTDELQGDDLGWDDEVRDYYGERVAGVSGGGFGGASIL